MMGLMMVEWCQARHQSSSWSLQTKALEDVINFDLLLLLSNIWFGVLLMCICYTCPTEKERYTHVLTKRRWRVSVLPGKTRWDDESVDGPDFEWFVVEVGQWGRLVNLSRWVFLSDFI